MTWEIRFSPRAAKAYKKLDKQNRSRVSQLLREVSRLPNPRSRGKALSGNRSGLWRWRVGDLRIIADIVDESIVVVVVDLGHRSKIYKG